MEDKDKNVLCKYGGALEIVRGIDIAQGRALLC